jgi:hypothetical protein
MGDSTAMQTALPKQTFIPRCTAAPAAEWSWR